MAVSAAAPGDVFPELSESYLRSLDPGPDADRVDIPLHGHGRDLSIDATGFDPSGFQGAHVDTDAGVVSLPVERWLASISTPAPGSWETAPPDGRLLDAIAAFPRDLLSDDQTLSGTIALERIIAAAQGLQAAMMAEFATRRPLNPDPHTTLNNGADVDEFAGEEIAAALTLAPITGIRRLDRALELAHRLPGTLAAMQAGHVTAAKARVLSEETLNLTVNDTAAVENRTLSDAVGQTPGQFRRTVKKAVLAVNADAAIHREKAATTDRRIGVQDRADGMADFWAHLPAADAHALYARLNEWAHDNRGTDNRTMDQLRADALSDLTWDTLGPAGAPFIHIVLSESTLQGRDNDPAELLGYGPITATTARRIAADGIWQALHTDETGTLTGIGQHQYRPTAALTRLIRGRDRTCRWTGCRRAARTCDIDHTTHFPTGKTITCNLACLCRRHHRAKTRDENRKTGWHMRQISGTITWTSPTGRTYTTQPYKLPAPENPPPETRPPEAEPPPF